MSHFIRTAPVLNALIVLTAFTALTACHKPPQKDAEKPLAPPPLSTAPLSFNKTTDDADVSLTFPETIRVLGPLHDRLYTEGQSELSAFVDKAHKDRAELVADGFPVPAYYSHVEWKITAQGSRLVSLFAVQDAFNGGAHPNSTFQALLWDKGRNDLIDPSALFIPGADLKPVDAYLCQQIETERSRRAHRPLSQRRSGFTCPKLSDSRLILIPATQGGKIGAIDALYQPYEVGAYSEGPYEIRVPQGQLKGLLNPEYAAEFAGEPVAATGLQFPAPDLASK